jgi:hypothetical protein
MKRKETDETLRRTVTIYGMLVAGLAASYILFILGVI